MSTAAPTISFSGLASGLDTTSIISQLTATAQIPITNLNKQVSGYNAQLSDWQTFNSNLAALQAAVTTLSNQSTVNAPASSSTNTAAATITTQVGAAVGSHSLSVTQLAQAQEVVSASESSGTTALSLSGSFTLNGKTIQINSGDALQDVASKINAAGAGATANVVAVGTNDYRLTLTSAQTGVANSLAAADTGGTVLGSLGLIQSGAAAVRQSVSYTQGGTAYTGAGSLTLASASQAIGTQLGIAAGAAPSGTFHLSNGGTGSGSQADIAVNLNTDSLSSIANAVNQAGISGISAEVVTVPDANGNLNRLQQLRIVSSGSTAAVPSTATAAVPGPSPAAETYGGSFVVDDQTVNLSGNANTISQVQAAIQATAGNSGLTAKISGSNLVLTDPSGNPISATLTNLHSYAGTRNYGTFGNPAITNGSQFGPAATAFTDAGGVLSTLGILQNAYPNTIAQAQDAQFTLDGLALTRSTNTLNDVITGATVSLLSGTAAAPAATTLNVTQNTQAVVQAVSAFASAYNAVQDFVTNENKFTAPTTNASGASGSSPALFGDNTLTQIQQTLSQALTAVSGKNTLQSIGVTLNNSNDLTVDKNALTTALQADPNIVSNLFGLSGTSDSPTVQFVKGSAKSAASTGAGYAVAITQPATQAGGTAGTASTSGAVSAAPEKLTFGGGLFNPPVNLTVPTGSTIQQTAALINASSSLNTQIYASVNASNHLVISSQAYGSNTGFTVSSILAASSGNSGIGPALSVTAGRDVAGTINGEAAIGIGRTLTGSLGDAHASGIQLLVTATAPTPAGSPSHVTLTHGVADGLSAALTQILDPTSGSVIGAENALNSQVSSAQAQEVQIQTTVDNYKAYLTQIFSELETRVSTLQAQGSAFTAAFGGSTNSGSSSTSSAKSSG